MKKFKVKELRFSNLLVEDINVPKNLLEDLEIEGPKNFAKNPTITKRLQKRRKVLKNYIDEIGEEDS